MDVFSYLLLLFALIDHFSHFPWERSEKKSRPPWPYMAPRQPPWPELLGVGVLGVLGVLGDGRAERTGSIP